MKIVEQVWQRGKITAPQSKDIEFDYLSLHVEKVFFSGCNFCQSKNGVQVNRVKSQL